MKARQVHLFSLSLVLLTAFARLDVAAQTTAATARALPLWKVEGGKSPVYLLGSLHFLKATNYPLASPIESAYSNAQVVAFETDMEKLEAPEAAMKLLAKSQLPEGKTLRSVLPAAVYSNFVTHAEAADLPPEMFARMKPSIAVLSVVAVEVQKLGFRPEHGVDHHYLKRAKRDGKEVLPLETVDFQIDLITEFSEDEVGLLVKTTLEEFDQVKDSVREIVAAWESGDADALEKLLNEATREAPGIFKRLVADRNHAWLPHIEKLVHGDKPALVVVGAAHLVGPDGVVKLLQNRGLKVTQVR
jgi:hypothetical protein